MADAELKQRLAAILAADAAGYSRLMSLDERATVAALDEARSVFRTKIEANRGRVIDMAGDSVLAIFETATGATSAAITIQNELAARAAVVPEDRRMRFRIGIHLGEVMEKPDGSIYGDGVNIAARVQALTDPGGVSVSDSVRGAVRGKIEGRFADQGEQSLKNIAEPVRVFRIEVGNGSAPSQAQTNEPAQSGPPRLSIIVLPFVNIGGGQEQDYFVDGVTESLTTDLSRVAGSFVIARNTAFTYKGKPADAKQIGREMNVRYALEGSVQRGGNRLRVNVQLVDTGTGAHIWAERFDKPIADLFDMQDEIVAHIARQLGTQLVAAEARRAERSAHPDAMDLCFQGTALMNKSRSRESLMQARGYYERALALESDNVEALVGIASVEVILGSAQIAEDTKAHLAFAETAATKALAKAPHHPRARMFLGWIKMRTNRMIEGIADCEHALSLDANLAAAHAYIGAGKYFLGRPHESEIHVRDAMRLSPRDPEAYIWMIFNGYAAFADGRNEEALTWARRSIEINPELPLAHFAMAAFLAQLGRLDEARAAVKTGLALEPRFTLNRLRGAAPSDNPAYLAHLKRVMACMRLAGVPE
jgi:TolB-like protein/class 3 adenylate cyclase/Flp pilus assembly protein TadD